MTISIGSVAPAPSSGSTRQEAQEARRRQQVIRLVMLAVAARAAVNRRTLAGAIVLAIGLVAAKRIASEGGIPGMDWYLARGRDQSRSSE
jgi:hypothetical protein